MTTICIHLFQIFFRERADVKLGGLVIEIKGKYVTLVIICLFFISSTAFAVSTHASLVETPRPRDVLVLQVGNDHPVSRASEIIQEIFEQRNLAITEKADSFIEFSYQATSFVNKPQAANLLHVDVAQTSIDDMRSTVSKHRASVVIVVGHGTEDGMQDEDSASSWSSVVDSISAARQGATVFATCFGSNGAELVERGYGFEGVVDAVATAYIVSTIVLGAYDGLDARTTKAAAQSGIERGTSLISGKATALPLSIPVPDWWLPLKLGLVAVLSLAYYFVAPATAPKTAIELGWLLAGIAFIITIIYLIAEGINWVLDISASFLTGLDPSVQGNVDILKNFTGLVASYIGGQIAAILNGGTAHPTFWSWLDQARVVKAGQLGAESATAADPDPLTRGMFAASSACLFVSFLDLLIIIGCTLWPDPPPEDPPPEDPPPDPPPPDGGGGTKPGIIIGID